MPCAAPFVAVGGLGRVRRTIVEQQEHPADEGQSQQPRNLSREQLLPQGNIRADEGIFSSPLPPPALPPVVPQAAQHSYGPPAHAPFEYASPSLGIAGAAPAASPTIAADVGPDPAAPVNGQWRLPMSVLAAVL